MRALWKCVVWHHFAKRANHITTFDNRVSMRLPGTRYQEHGWEQVRKLLGHCSLTAFAQMNLAGLPEALDLYVDLTAEALHGQARSSRAAAPGNSYGESAYELATSLLYELQARRGDWAALCAAVAAEVARLGAFWTRPEGEAILRKKVNDLYAVLRDKVDADNYQAACGHACSANRIYTYRMLDTAYTAICALFADWERHAGQIGAILGRSIAAVPIEARQMKSIADCKAEWVIAWSASLEQFGGAPGPLHTRSKRFASLKNNPARIAAMLAEIGEYEALSCNRDSDWLSDASEAGAWLDDLARVLGEADNPGDSQLLPAPDDEEESQPEEAPLPAPGEQEQALAQAVSLPPSFMQMARAAQDRASWSARMLADESLPVRLAVYAKLLGGADESYPDEWLDPATGELPTMQQLAQLDQLSLPTLRKRRDAAIGRLQASAIQGGLT
jgi:hypothetical protein